MNATSKPTLTLSQRGKSVKDDIRSVDKAGPDSRLDQNIASRLNVLTLLTGLSGFVRECPYSRIYTAQYFRSPWALHLKMKSWSSPVSIYLRESQTFESLMKSLDTAL